MRAVSRAGLERMGPCMQRAEAGATMVGRNASLVNLLCNERVVRVLPYHCLPAAEVKAVPALLFWLLVAPDAALQPASLHRDMVGDMGPMCLLCHRSPVLVILLEQTVPVRPCPVLFILWHYQGPSCGCAGPGNK